MADPITAAFERLARDFLSVHSLIRHEWRDVKEWWGSRRDLVFPPPAPEVPEVFVSLMDYGQIAVGTGQSHDDFEDFGRGLTDEQVAQEAFDRLVELLRGNGYLK
jgi:hypothetical protein